MEWFFLVVAVFWLTWANGANDNFKGVATLYGCKAMDQANQKSASAGSVLRIREVGHEAISRPAGL